MESRDFKQNGSTVYAECEMLSVVLADIYLNIAKYCVLEYLSKAFISISELQYHTRIPKDELIDILKELKRKKLIYKKNGWLYVNYNLPPRKRNTVLILDMIRLRNQELSYSQIAKKLNISREEVYECLTYLLKQKNIPEKTQKAFSRKQQVESIQKKKNATKKVKHNNKKLYSVS